MKLEYDNDTGVINVDHILNCLPDIPLEVAKQFLSDHGRKEHFQLQYARLDLAKLRWNRVYETAEKISMASVFSEFRNWFEQVGYRAEDIAIKNWQCIDRRQAVQAHWREHQTWLVPPILLRGDLVSTCSRYHLAEGHTRVGLLRGLISKGILASDSMHIIWLGASS